VLHLSILVAGITVEARAAQFTNSILIYSVGRGEDSVDNSESLVLKINCDERLYA
jgi:hypothetical protein